MIFKSKDFSKKSFIYLLMDHSLGKQQEKMIDFKKKEMSVKKKILMVIIIMRDSMLISNVRLKINL